MKNYVQLFYVRIYDSFDAFFLSTFSASKDEANAFIKNMVENVVPGGRGDVNMGYFLANKENIRTQLSQVNMGLPFTGPVLEIKNLWVLSTDDAQDWGTESPNWTSDPSDPASVKALEVAKKVLLNEKQGNLSGAPTLLAILNSLPSFAAQLKKQGRVRDAGIVMYAYNQVIAGIWSITDALKYLDDNGIFA